MLIRDRIFNKLEELKMTQKAAVDDQRLAQEAHKSDGREDHDHL